MDVAEIILKNECVQGFLNFFILTGGWIAFFKNAPVRVDKIHRQILTA